MLRRLAMAGAGALSVASVASMSGTPRHADAARAPPSPTTTTLSPTTPSPPTTPISSAGQQQQQQPGAAPPTGGASGGGGEDAEGVTFRVYDGRDGSPRSLSDVVRAAAAAPSGGGGGGGTVLLIGEAHDDAVAHAFERHLLREVWAAVAAGPARRTSLCLEMFERDVQGVLDEVLTVSGGVAGGIGGAGARSSVAAAGAAAAAGGDGNDDTEIGDGLQPLLLQRAPPPTTNANANAASASSSSSPASPPSPAPPPPPAPSSLFREEDLLRDARPWPNYAADYRPLVMDAVSHGARVVAANAPRRYVSVAGRHGAAALEAALPPGCRAREWLAPLPHVPASRAYAQRIEAAMTAAAEAMRGGRQQHEQQQEQQQKQQQQSGGAATGKVDGGQAPAPNSSSSSGANSAKEGGAGKEGGGGCPYTGFSVSSNFLAAQNAWDATMAWTVAQELLSPAGSPAAAGPPSLPPLVALVAGRFHIERGLGVCEHLARYCAAAAGSPPRVVAVTVVQSASVSMSPEQLGREGALGLADFLVLSDARMPPSFRSVHL